MRPRKTRRRHRRAQPAGDLAGMPDGCRQSARSGWIRQLLFFDAGDEVLLRRYSDTRRRHPLSHLGLALADAIALRAPGAQAAAAIADVVIDTSDAQRPPAAPPDHHRVRPGRSVGLSLLFESFAYRRGVPPDADFVFDARVLPNPHWDARLRPLSGRDGDVRDYLEAQPDVVAVRRPGRTASSTPGCRACKRTRAATSRSPSAAPAAAIVRCTWPNAWPQPLPRERGWARSGGAPSRAGLSALSDAALVITVC